jgi:imidazolonepropionase-like amidohydrolase/Tol biopolymer transport system component
LRRYIVILLGSLFFSTPLSAMGDTAETGWDIEAPHGATITHVPIATDQGTWMDVDVSPDGQTLAFALLGDIYTMPIEGGNPTRIASGLSWEVQPRFSPDGSRIAFTSDRGGGDNIWVMEIDGSDKRQVTNESFRLLNQPTWSPDGRFIVAKKHFTTGRSLGTGEIWIYHVSGGSGVQLVERTNPQFQKELGEPIYAPQGDAIYFTRNITPGNTFIYAQDSNSGIFAVERLDVATGEVITAISGFGGAVRPTPSPDGKYLSFVRRDKDQSQLWVKNIETGVEHMVYGDLDQDMQETWAVYGAYPNMDWMPDSGSIVFWAGGKIRRVKVDGSGGQVIPFAINDTRAILGAPHPTIEVSPTTFETKIPRFATLDTRSQRIVFESLGKLYSKNVSGRDLPRRLTDENSNSLELWPVFSRDGQQLAFVRWNDENLGEIIVANSDGSNPRTITSEPGHYARPEFSPDGRLLVFEKRGGGYLTDPNYSENPGIYFTETSGGSPTLITRSGTNPHFGSRNDRIFLNVFGDNQLSLISSNLNGNDVRTHARGDLVSQYRVSPDEQTVVFRQNYEAFIMPMMPGGKPVSVGENSSSFPIVKVSDGGADYVNFSSGGEVVSWSIGPLFQTTRVSEIFEDAPRHDEVEEKSSVPVSETSLSMTVTSARPDEILALIGARLLTMQGDEAGVIENGALVITGDRISAVGTMDEISIPRDAQIINVDGKVIMPGLIDAHAHGPYGTDDLIPQQNWRQIQDLAMGVTTIHDPSSRASMVFAAAERQRAGMLLAPRTFSTGEIIYGAKAPGIYARIDSYDDALAHVRRIKAQGGISVKNYNQPRREQRQMVARAAAAENMLVVAEGGSLFGMDMNLIADGNSTIEHNIPGEHFYDDVLQFIGQSQTNYTPTLVVTYGGLAGDPYWRQATDVFSHPLLVHTSPRHLLSETARRTKAPDWAFVDDDAAREAKKFADRGVRVSIGAHGQQAGIAAHWEMWSFARGGMSATEALRAGTIEAAHSLGMQNDIGSLEVGKLADLIILRADPTHNIRESDQIEQVMLGGRLYDAKTMDEILTGDSQRLKYWWE